MTEEQRRQAAAKRCAELANARGGCYADEHFLLIPTSVQGALLNAILELDELAQATIEDGVSPRVYYIARKHILPEPKPSPVERLSQKIWDGDPAVFQKHMEELGLKLVEVDPSDDQ